MTLTSQPPKPSLPPNQDRREQANVNPNPPTTRPTMPKMPSPPSKK